MCNVLTVTFHDWALNFHWFHLFRRGKRRSKTLKTTTSSYSRDRSLTTRGSKPFHSFPFPRPSPVSERLLNGSTVPNSGTKPANFDSLTDFHFISVQNWWNFDRKLKYKHGKYKTAFRVRNAGYREFRETRPAGPRRSEGKRQKQTKTTTTATKTGRNSENQRVKRAEWWTGWLRSPIVFFLRPLTQCFFFHLIFPLNAELILRLPQPNLVRCCAVLTPR